MSSGGAAEDLRWEGWRSCCGCSSVVDREDAVLLKLLVWLLLLLFFGRLTSIVSRCFALITAVTSPSCETAEPLLAFILMLLLVLLGTTAHEERCSL